MKINLISGSQKIGRSNSGIILNRLNDIIKEKHSVKIYNSGIKLFTDEIFKEIISSDAIVLAFPIFGDSIPSHTLKMLIELEDNIKRERVNGLVMYAIINCGFYEGRQNHVAFDMIKHWCERSGVKFGGGIGQGAGEMVGQTLQYPIDKGPFNNLYRSLQAMVKHIERKEPLGITYLSPYFPRFLWKFMGTRYWHGLASKNGLTKKDLRRKL